MSEKIKLWEVKAKNQDGEIVFRKRYKKLQIIDMRDKVLDFSKVDFSTMDFLYKEDTDENISKS